MMNFKELIIRAKKGEAEAQESLLEMYRPLIAREAIINGIFDEDLFQELCFKFIHCIDRFELEEQN